MLSVLHRLRGVRVCRQRRCSTPHLIPQATTATTTMTRGGRRRTTTTTTPTPTRQFDDIPKQPLAAYLTDVVLHVTGRRKPRYYHEELRRDFRLYGDIFRKRHQGKEVLYIRDQDIIRQFLQQEDRQPILPALLGDLKDMKRSNSSALGIGNMNGESWYRLRNAFQRPMMLPTSADQYVTAVDQVAIDFTEHIASDNAKKPHANFIDDLSKYCLESAAVLCFDVRLGALTAATDSAHQKMIDSIYAVKLSSHKLQSQMFPWHRWLATPGLRKLVASEEYCQNYIDELLQAALSNVAALERDGDLRGQYPLLRSLLQLTHVSRADALSAVTDMMIDSPRAIVPNLASQLYCLATNPEKQEKLYQEVRRVVGDTSQPLVCDVTKRMTYLNACFKECFRSAFLCGPQNGVMYVVSYVGPSSILVRRPQDTRLFPSDVGIYRTTKTDITIGGYDIPPGTDVQLVTSLLLDDSAAFARPRSFEPDRWLPGDRSANKRHYPMVSPFGFGARACLGRRFAQLQIRLALVRLVQKYHIDWIADEPMRTRLVINIEPDTPVRFRFTARNTVS